MANNDLKEIHIIDEDKNTNLHAMAARGEHQALMEVNVGQKIDSQNSYGWTPLMVAAREGHLETVQALLAKRADASKVNKYNGSVFLMAVASGNLDLINVLLQHLLSGGVSRQTMQIYFSPIALSILFNHEHIFNYLLGKGFDLNAASMSTNLTPLMFASLNDNPVFIQHLLANGVDPHVRNASNDTAEDLACRGNGNVQHEVIQVPTMNTQMVILTPQQSFINPFLMSRKSSNAMTPEVITPIISPIGFNPQIFFPPDFSPAHYGASNYYGCGLSPYASQEFIMSPFFAIHSPSNMYNMNVSNLNLSQLH